MDSTPTVSVLTAIALYYSSVRQRFFLNETLGAAVPPKAGPA
jgi:hypothetical protein